eukprot:TRINITY_DN26917_c0_g1_i2.p1 TRINITY_DN26917_c0_g1~~TRINITY_DN26917_c0_g1_i2.p1  ORF type:complete len:719 (+),score=46.38 TRINITY_DN26917_c0_g1_i2:56-2212(+)
MSDSAASFPTEYDATTFVSYDDTLYHSPVTKECSTTAGDSIERLYRQFTQAKSQGLTTYAQVLENKIRKYHEQQHNYHKAAIDRANCAFVVHDRPPSRGHSVTPPPQQQLRRASSGSYQPQRSSDLDTRRTPRRASAGTSTGGSRDMARAPRPKQIDLKAPPTKSSHMPDANMQVNQLFSTDPYQHHHHHYGTQTYHHYGGQNANMYPTRSKDGHRSSPSPSHNHPSGTSRRLSVEALAGLNARTKDMNIPIYGTHNPKKRPESWIGEERRSSPTRAYGVPNSKVTTTKEALLGLSSPTTHIAHQYQRPMYNSTPTPTPPQQRLSSTYTYNHIWKYATAALRIQCCWRCHIARKRVARKRTQAQQTKQQNAQQNKPRSSPQTSNSASQTLKRAPPKTSAGYNSTQTRKDDPMHVTVDLPGWGQVHLQSTPTRSGRSTPVKMSPNTPNRRGSPGGGVPRAHANKSPSVKSMSSPVGRSTPTRASRTPTKDHMPVTRNNPPRASTFLDRVRHPLLDPPSVTTAELHGSSPMPIRGMSQKGSSSTASNPQQLMASLFGSASQGGSSRQSVSSTPPVPPLVGRSNSPSRGPTPNTMTIDSTLYPGSHPHQGCSSASSASSCYTTTTNSTMPQQQPTWRAPHQHDRGSGRSPLASVDSTKNKQMDELKDKYVNVFKDLIEISKDSFEMGGEGALGQSWSENTPQTSGKATPTINILFQYNAPT